MINKGKNIPGLEIDSIVWDNHACMPLRPNDTSFLPQLSRLRNVGVDIVSLNIGMDMNTCDDIIAMAHTFRNWIIQHDDEYMLVGNQREIKQAKAQGKLGIFFDLEGGKPLNYKAHMVQVYYLLGVRWMLMAYNQNNELAGGCHDNDQGLTNFGRDILTEMNHVGMIPCCSHVGETSAKEIFELSETPVILSHSNPRAMHNHDRNVSDDILKACAATGGVVGINGIGIFLGDNDNRTETFANHIDYAVQLIGPNHVGLGLDYVFDQQELDDWLDNNMDQFPAGQNYGAGIKMIEPERLPEIAKNLMNKGYSRQNISAIFGHNFARLAQQIWK